MVPAPHMPKSNAKRRSHSRKAGAPSNVERRGKHDVAAYCHDALLKLGRQLRVADGVGGELQLAQQLHQPPRHSDDAALKQVRVLADLAEAGALVRAPTGKIIGLGFRVRVLWLQQGS
jgi:hypothetical protein